MVNNCKKYKAIVFDLDGTLLDTSEGILDSLKYVLAKEGLQPFDKNNFGQFIGPPIQSSLQEAYGLMPNEAKRIANAFRERYSTVDLYKAQLYNDVIYMLDTLKSFKYAVGVATYKRKDYATEILKNFNLLSFFDCVEGSDFEGKLKKEDILLKCIHKCGCLKSEVLMVGDTKNDQAGAQKLGIDFLAVTYGFGFRDGDDIYPSCNDCCGIVKYILNTERRSGSSRD